MNQLIWQQPKIITWSQILLNSYQKLLGLPLLKLDNLTEIELAKTLFEAPYVVVSHGTETDPILNYGNQIALDLWGMNWETFTKTPSRQTAEPINQETRQKMLIEASQKGFINNYEGVRISSQGKKFFIKNAIIWNLVDTNNKYCGQAATFSEWTFLYK